MFSVASAAGQPVIPPKADCMTVQQVLAASLTPRMLKGKAPRPTFTGRCRYDLDFKNVALPYDLARVLDDQRPVLEDCVKFWEGRKYYDPMTAKDPATGEYIPSYWEVSHYTANIELWTILSWESTAQVRVVNATEHPSDGIHTSLDRCIEDALEAVSLPVTHAPGHRIGYRVVWHFVYPLDTRAWLDDEFPFTIPEPPARPEVIPIGPQIEDP
ncbi:MAG: hypothetical protein AAB865_01645 [Patescibacteria group bacterium]